MDTAVLQRSLAILESMVLNSQDLYQKVAQEITIGQLIPHLQGYGAGIIDNSVYLKEKFIHLFIPICHVFFSIYWKYVVTVRLQKLQ